MHIPLAAGDTYKVELVTMPDSTTSLRVTVNDEGSPEATERHHRVLIASGAFLPIEQQKVSGSPPVEDRP